MDATTFFDNLMYLFMFAAALTILVAAAHILDNLLDPPCNCAEIRRQETEARGAVL